MAKPLEVSPAMSSINPDRLFLEPPSSLLLREPAWLADGKTDNAGHYLIPLLPVGTYTVRVDAAGFQSAESKDLRLQVDEARELDFSLVPATVVTTVAVSGDAVAVETANPSLGQVITSQQVRSCP
jgi:hypothetical protein